MVLCLPDIFFNQTLNKKVVFLHDLKHICGPKQSAQHGMSCALKTIKNGQKMASHIFSNFFLSKKNTIKNENYVTDMLQFTQILIL